MATDILQAIREAKGDARVSHNWYIDKVKELVGTQYPGPQFQREYASNMTNKLMPGRMYLINYSNPVNKDTLPYYDVFPLIMPFEMTSTHMTAINFHYLHPTQRLILLEKLSMYKIGTNDDITTKIRADWKLLSNFARFREVKPAVKQYRRNRIKGRYLFIQPEDWATAIILPTEQFKKASKQKVYVDSNRAMRQI